ncbi:MAG: hypothetical protein JWP37_4137 [Mucilaginibacter sp.]|nr:hypothetical protein [Mucilaginibacter sp.]
MDNMEASFKENWFKKTWWKYTDRTKYRSYKQQLSYNRTYAQINKFISENKNVTADEIFESIGDSREINLVHSGNAGDIIYSLPVVKRLHEMTSKPVNYFLKLNEPLLLLPGDVHPLGNVMLNRTMADNLKPLLNSQPYIDKTSIYNDQEVHLDLSLFRESGLELDKGNIARWNFYTTGINANLSEPWLDVQQRSEFSDSIVLSRSSRYNNPLISYSFLSEHKNVVFLGVKSEYERMKKSISNLYWHPVNDFLEMAEVIRGSKLFIGNQSFPFSIAEALKVVRLLEVFHLIPNVIPEGRNGYDFHFQKHFEYLVTSLVSNEKHYSYK